MPDCEDYTNEDIQAACEDMQGLDDEQKFERLYDLLKDLDEEYDTISATLGEESNKMGKELVELSLFLYDNLTLNSNNLIDDPDLFWRSYTLSHMITDFVVDGNVSDDLFAKYEQYADIRKEYIEQLLADIPKVSIFPNPASDIAHINVKYTYGFHEFGATATYATVGSGQELPDFDPLYWLPKKLESTFQENNLQQQYFNGKVIDINGQEKGKIKLLADMDGNIQGSLDVSGLENGTYFVSVYMPGLGTEDITGELRNAGASTERSVFTQKMIVAH